MFRTDQLAHPRYLGHGVLGICHSYHCLAVIWIHDFLSSLKEARVTSNLSFFFCNIGSLTEGECGLMNAFASYLASESLGPQILVNGSLEDEDPR